MPSTSATKKIVLVFDLLCVLLALVLISFGIYILCTYDTNTVGASAAYAYIGVGVATIVIFLLGCLGALRENVCCTVTFIVLVCIVMIAQLVVVAILVYKENDIGSNLAITIDEAWEEELESAGAMSIYESWLNCCGRASPQDYIVNDRVPPNTCFKNTDVARPDDLILNGCRVAFENYWTNLLHIFNILAFVMIGMEFLRTIISCCLCNSIRNDSRRSYF